MQKLARQQYCWQQKPYPFKAGSATFVFSGERERVVDLLIKDCLVDVLIVHISRDGTAIKARERPVVRKQAATTADAQVNLIPVEAVISVTAETAAPAIKRDRPRRGEVHTPAKAPPSAASSRNVGANDREYPNDL
jgi:hypothetical protein